MKRVPVVTTVTLFTLCDFAITTILFSHIGEFHEEIGKGAYSYRFNRSVFDLWCLGGLRAAVAFGLVIGVLVNAHDTPKRLSRFTPAAVCLSSIVCMVTLIKLLIVSETPEHLQQFWSWSIYVWTLIGSLGFLLDWVLIGKVSILSAPLVTLSVNCDGDNSGEREPLLGTNTSKGETSDGAADTVVKETRTKSIILRLLSYSKPDLPWILTAFFFLTVSATGEIFIPFYTGKVVDGIVIDKSQAEFTQAIISMAIISFCSALAAGIRGGCFSIAINRLNIRIRNLLFSSLMRQEIGFFDQVRTGDITSRMTSDTTTMSDAVGLNVNIFLRNMIKAIGVVFFMFKLSWRLTVVTLIGLPSILAVSKIYGGYYQKLSEQVQDSLAEANSVAEESCSTMKTVRSFANEEGEIGRYGTALAHTYSLYKKEALMYSGYVWSTRFFELALTVAILYYGGHLVVSGKLTGGTLVSFILYQIQMGDCMDSMGEVYTGLMQAAGASMKVFQYMDRKPRIVNTGKLAPEHLQGHLQFKDVSFSYPTRPEKQVLKNVSFTVRPGEVVALVGPSGGGKTSCVNLLEHFYETASGQILLDSVPIQDYDHYYLHKQVSLVGQEPVLYGRSIRENISYGLADSDWTEQQVEEVSKQANAHQFVSEMTEGYKTQAGEKGIQLSGGQKQRIAIARALLRNPTVVILDEATSALDAESEHLVQEALYKNVFRRTVLIIAHRLSTVERADRIIVIDKGQVVEQGTHQQLLQQKGLYTSLVKRQLLSQGRERQPSGAENSVYCTCGRRRISSGGSVHRYLGAASCLSSDSSFDKSSPKVTFIIGSV